MPYCARNGFFVASLGLVVSSAVVGCADKNAQVIRPESFYAGGTSAPAQPANSSIGGNPNSTSDRSGSLYTQVGNGVDILRPPGEREASEPGVKSISPVVRDSVQSPAEAATRASASASVAKSEPRALASTQASTRGKSSGQYVTIGGVVAEVNGTAIYADKVLKAISLELSAKAKDLDEKKFEKFATELISKQVQYYVSNELEYAAAERNLAADEKTLADNLTLQWRNKRIIEAGGSVEIARKRAAADGEDFEELVHEQYRSYLIRIFYEKRVIPRIQVTAEDMRRYYQLKKDKEFTDQDQVQFRLIKIDPAKSGGKEKAIDKAADIRKRAAGREGVDFATLAESNDDAALMRSKGKVGGGDGWIQKGAFTLTKVENAVFALQPGEVTDVIEENGAFYVAKLENRKIGRVLPFEDESVQDKITSTLRKAQFAVLREQVQDNLRKNAIIRIDNGMVETAIEMAMQNYPSWSTGA